MKLHKNLSNDNYAVSPLIAEILMVTIVVIVGAIIASFAFGLTDKPIQGDYLVAMSAEKINDNNILVTFRGGQDADQVLHIYVSVNSSYYNGTSDTWSTTQVDTFGGNGVDPIEVGTVKLLTDDSSGPITSKKDHVIATAGFKDGTQQVVLDTKV